MSAHLEAMQTAQAEAALRGLTPEEFRVCYPYAALHGVAGYHQRGEVDMLGAFTGAGKSTLMAGITTRHLANGVNVILGGFELGPDVWRRVLAAQVAGVDPGAVMSGLWEDWPEAEYAAAYAKVQAQVRAMSGPHAKGTAWELLHIADDDFVSARSMERLGQMALDAERATKRPSVIIVDHIDHTDPAGFEAEVTKQAVFALHGHGKRYGTRWLMTSQLNREGAPGNPFFQHYPLRESYFRGAAHKGYVCTRIFGAYRPLDPNVTPDDLAAVKADRKPLAEVLAKGVMAVNVIKGRWTRSLGQRALLGWDKGTIVDLPPYEAEAWGMAASDLVTRPPTRRGAP